MNMHTGEKATLVTLCGTLVVVALVAGCQPAPAPVVYIPVPAKADPGPAAFTVASARSFLQKNPDPRKVMTEAERYRAAENREAVFLMVKYAARRGLPEAEYELGRRYDPKTHSKDGIVLRPNVKVAAEWFKRAAHAGHVGAMTRLGELYRDGQIVAEGDKDATELGFYWLDRAAQARGAQR
jgi:TPR repeat protein